MMIFHPANIRMDHPGLQPLSVILEGSGVAIIDVGVMLKSEQ